MNEFPIDPTLGLLAEFSLAGLEIIVPFGVMTEKSRVVVLIKKAEARGEVGNEHEITKDINVGRQGEGLSHCFEVLPVEGKPLHAAVGAIGHYKGRLVLSPGVDPDAVGKVELAIILSRRADG